MTALHDLVELARRGKLFEYQTLSPNCYLIRSDHIDYEPIGDKLPATIEEADRAVRIANQTFVKAVAIVRDHLNHELGGI